MKKGNMMPRLLQRTSQCLAFFGMAITSKGGQHALPTEAFSSENDSTLMSQMSNPLDRYQPSTSLSIHDLTTQPFQTQFQQQQTYIQSSFNQRPKTPTEAFQIFSQSEFPQTLPRDRASQPQSLSCCSSPVIVTTFFESLLGDFSKDESPHWLSLYDDTAPHHSPFECLDTPLTSNGLPDRSTPDNQPPVKHPSTLSTAPIPEFLSNPKSTGFVPANQSSSRGPTTLSISNDVLPQSPCPLGSYMLRNFSSPTFTEDSLATPQETHLDTQASHTMTAAPIPAATLVLELASVKPQSARYLSPSGATVRSTKPEKSRLPKTPIECKYPGCGKKFSRQWDMSEHMRAEHEGKRHQCTQCKVEFKHKKNLVEHMKVKHNPSGSPTTIECKYPGCGKKFSYQSGMTEHMRVEHEGKRHQCTQCKGEFKARAILMEHMKVKHNPSGSPTTIECKYPGCGKKFSYQSSMFQHMKVKHEGKRHQCTQCKAEFTQRKTLMQHTELKHNP